MAREVMQVDYGADEATVIAAYRQAVRELGPGWKLKAQDPDRIVMRAPYAGGGFQVWPVTIQVLPIPSTTVATLIELTGHLPLGVGPLQRRFVRRDISSLKERVEQILARAATG